MDTGTLQKRGAQERTRKIDLTALPIRSHAPLGVGGSEEFSDGECGGDSDQQYAREERTPKRSQLSNGLRVDTGKLHDVLDKYGIANSLEVYPDRFQNHVMPFFNQNLCFQVGGR